MYYPHRGRSAAYRGFRAGTRSGCIIPVISVFVIVSLIIICFIYIL
jgi:hypothetical protein